MKRCPTCNRTFTDPSLSFCIEDGTPLVKAIAQEADPEATLVAKSPARTPPDAEARQTEGSASGNWNAPAYQPPAQSPPVAAQRRAWPWVVGIVVLLLVGVIGIGIAAAIVVPKMMQAAGNENNSNTNANSTRNLNSNVAANSNANANSNSLVTNQNQNANANSNANAGSLTEAPTDADEVLADLTAIEKEWTEANFSADRKKLAHILADDYVGTQPDGTIQGKGDYLRDIKPDKTVRDWEFKDLRLTLKGDRATLKGKMRLEREGEDEELVVQFTDKFVWRDERWQAVASEVSQAK